jgi:uncharacterized UBP type Zn finger protein
MYKTDRKLYDHTAKQWTETHAKEITVESKLAKLTEMGFPEDMCKEALERYDMDENLALNFLLGG